MVQATIAIEQINEKTFPDLKKLVLEQAGHHESKYVGDDKKFVEALTAKNAVPKIVTVRDDDSGAALGYILYNHYYGLKGQELYMEDLLVARGQRSHGFGLAMMQELRAIGHDMGVDKISWTVAENNPAAVSFYEKKVGAKPLDYGVYDCGDLYKKPVAAPAGYDAHRVDAHDLDLLESYVGRIPALTKEKMANIRAAAAADHVSVYIVLGDDGTPKAVGITNANFSSFRAVFGYKLEMMELQPKDDNDAVAAFKALTSCVVKVGEAEGYTGHLNIAIDKKSSGQQLFMKGLGFAPIRMTNDPASVFLLYATNCQKPAAPVPQNVVSSQQQKKAPPAP